MEKILLLTNAKCGGAERVTIAFAKILHSQGYDVTLLIYRIYEDDRCELLAFIPDGIKVDYISCRYRSLIWRFYKYLRNSDFKYVFTSLPLLNYVNIIVSRFLLNKVSIIRECNTPSRHSKIIRFMSACLYRFANIIISQTDDMKKEMANLYRISENKITTVYNPIDTELIAKSIQAEYKFPGDYKIYVAVGRVQSQKDYTTMLKAFAELLKKQPDSLLYIIGEDQSEYAIKQKTLVNQLNLHGSVFFEGFQSNPYKYLKGADCFVLSSEYEGLPNVMLEALYLGIPIVATASVPIVEDILQGNRYGICVPVKDVDLLAKAMYEIKKVGKHLGFNLSQNTFVKFLSLLNNRN